MDRDSVFAYLDQNNDYLEEYVNRKVPVDVLERWLIRKTKQEMSQKSQRKCSLSRWKFCVHADKRKMLQDITDSLKEHPTHEQVLWELGRCISSAVGVEGFRMYVVKLSPPVDIRMLFMSEDNKEVKALPVEKAKFLIIENVARDGFPVRVFSASDSTDCTGSLPSQGNARFTFYQPIVQPGKEATAVLEMWRSVNNFHEEDEEISSSYLVWGGIALHYAQLYLEMNSQRTMSDFLLNVVKSIFRDMVSMDTLIKKVMNYAQKLVDADRASLFLVDDKAKEMHARVFDLGLKADNQGISANGGGIKKPPKIQEIRFPVGTGIAGHVAQTGQILNIKDAYSDDRFNKTVDAVTGYKTKTILSMPIFIQNSIIGVVQMVNKRNGEFTKKDEQSFEMFAIYCGLALHHAKLYEKIQKSEQKYKVALEVLSYHNTCNEEEVQTALNDVPPVVVRGLGMFEFSPFSISDYEKVIQTIYMFTDLFGPTQFDRTALVKFVLTVKKNYRRVPYHNWTHGFAVANSMYNILKRTTRFSTNERMALLIAALCHDLDHRGKNNKYMTDTASPLAAMYSTSTMEHHHFNQTITILQQEGHNILNKLTNSDYKEVLDLIKHCILATDLVMFFEYEKQLEMLLRENLFAWNISENRKLVLAISMTSADLSASAKPWATQIETVRIIFQEFYEQGDMERANGQLPVPMMDRFRPEEQAVTQVGFLTGICLPCYLVLYRLIPETQPMLVMCQNNLEQWSRIQEDVRKYMENNPPGGFHPDVFPKHLYVYVSSKSN